MPLTVAQAAHETGLHRSSILRAIKRGVISGSRDESGQWTVEPAELFRVFKPAVRTEVPGDATRQLAQPDSPPRTDRSAGRTGRTGPIRTQGHARGHEGRPRPLAGRSRRMAGASASLAAQLTDQREPEPVEPMSWWAWLRSTG
jgi:hypothetical protein